MLASVLTHSCCDLQAGQMNSGSRLLWDAVCSLLCDPTKQFHLLHFGCNAIFTVTADNWSSCLQPLSATKQLVWEPASI